MPRAISVAVRAMARRLTRSGHRGWRVKMPDVMARCSVLWGEKGCTGGGIMSV